MIRFVWLLFSFFLSTSLLSEAQNMTQTVKGRVIDDISKMPLIGIGVIISFPDETSSSMIATETDTNGYYSFKNVPVGRINVLFTCIGYEQIARQNVSLDAGKELVINVGMAEDIQMLTSAIVVAERDKHRPINEMSSSVSGRTFSVAEAERYAGAVNDISRMAQNFAGVSTPSDASNDIVIRGNSPFGLLWRLEGVDIYNPNHFSDGGATGGPISMINLNALSNSDFYTSAFPAEYINAYSGVFDLKLREGNYDKREYTGQIGLNGVEFGIEGPLSQKLRASYLADYRYSFLDALKALGIGFGTGSAVPRYQDWTTKINVPTPKAGTFSLFSVGGVSNIALENGESTFYNFADDLRNKGNMGIIGLNHSLSINNRLSSVFSLAASTSLFHALIDTLNPVSKIKDRSQEAKIQREFFTAQAVFNIKVSPRVSLRTGAMGSMIGYKFISLDFSQTTYPKDVNEQGSTFVARVYIEGSYRPSTKITVNGGVNGQFLALNQSYSVDPRISVTYKLAQKHELNAGYGLHSQTQGLEVYLTKQWSQAADDPFYPNKNLKMTKSHHFVMGYQWRFSSIARLKVEAYYQYLYNLPINFYKPHYCLVNLTGLDFEKYGQVYVSEGEGENIGLEFTLERFLTRGWYYMATLSLYDSRFVSSDNVVRNTMYNGNYVFNLVGGKEFALKGIGSSSKGMWVIGTDAKFVLAGGQRYIPVDVASSNEEHKVVYRYDLAYEPQLPYYMRGDCKVWIKLNQPKTTHEFGFEARNVTDRKNVYQYRYDYNAKDMITTYQTGILPLAYYKITF
ncbi:MAG: TonB-dependent receptor [Prevotellaceae bacterium]|jgi:hypothetical protein|nr:TonB-dependent receptor [Prevotellaceae bacterium]